MTARKQQSRPKRHKGSARRAHQVRIIGGKWKRSLLPVSVVPDLRPSPNRVRETLFNWLNFFYDGNWADIECLDLFAGTGALGFEAASRGARHVFLVDQNRLAAEQMKNLVEKLGAEKQIRVLNADARAAVEQFSQAGKTFDVIFLDPPYSSSLLEAVLPACAALLKPEGYVYVESAELLDADNLSQLAQIKRHWHIIRRDRAGHVCFHLLQLQDFEQNQA